MLIHSQDGTWDNLEERCHKYHHHRTEEGSLRAVLMEGHDPLTQAGKHKLGRKMEVIKAVLNHLKECYLNDNEDFSLMAMTDQLAFHRLYTGQTVRNWALDFIRQGGKCRGCTFKRRDKTSLIHDEDARSTMTKWLLVATRNVPTAYARDFIVFVRTKFNVAIKVGMGVRWIKNLGFNFRRATSLELYRDGHEREDVVQAREIFIRKIFEEIYPRMVTWTGPDMDIEVVGEGIREAQRNGEDVPWSYELVCHDESTFQCKDGVRYRWMKPGCGTAQAKDRGACKMISAYINARIGLLTDSLEEFQPGKGVWWTGAKFIEQVCAYYNSYTCTLYLHLYLYLIPYQLRFRSHSPSSIRRWGR